MSIISKRNNSEFVFDFQDLNQGYISNRMLSDLDSLDDLLDDDAATLPVMERPAPCTVPLALVPEPEIERVLTPSIEGVLTPCRGEIEGVLTPTFHPSKLRNRDVEKSEIIEQNQCSYAGDDAFQPVHDFNTYSTPHNEIEEIEKIALSEITPAATHFTTRQNSLNSTPHGAQRSQLPDISSSSLYGAFGDFDAPQPDRADAGSAKPTPFTIARDHALSSQPERKDLQHFLDAKNLTDPFQHRWKSLTDRKRKFVLSSMLAHEQNGWFFSLDFHEDRAAELMKSPNPAMLFADRHLRKHLQACLGYVPAIALALEFDSKGKLHTHGICIPDMEQPDPGFKEKLAEALRLSASRTYKRKELYPTLANVKPIFEPLGLAAYILKDLSRTQKKISNNEANVMYSNREMKKITMSYHELVRK
ncbi:hypothetical protein [Brucella sp. 22210]|uniref:hypothetical protein n=1 Tax=Brucella sp. 22210 TaxID=3453892 RepID=UPI003F86346C